MPHILSEKNNRMTFVESHFVIYLTFQDVMHYEQLKAGVIQHDLLVDYLIYKVSSSD